MAPIVEATAVVKTFSACSLVLFVKVFATLFVQGGKAFAAGARPPEDSSLTAPGNPEQTYGAVLDKGDNSDKLLAARAIDYRWRRIVQNDAETIPIALAVFIGSILADGQEETNCALIAVFTAARIAHTIAYANEKQPHRTLLWLLGQLCVLASALNGFISFLIN